MERHTRPRLPVGHVSAVFTMSLDGFIANPDDTVDPLFRWYDSGDTPFTSPDGSMTWHVSAASADVLRGMMAATGALVVGRHLFDVTDGWKGRHPIDVPVVVLTHHPPQDWIDRHPDAPFHFVEGIEAAVATAQGLAGGKNVDVGGSETIQQALRAGLVDEVGVDLAPFLLGEGVRVFDHLGPTTIELERTRVVEGTGVTHLRFRVVRP